MKNNLNVKKIKTNDLLALWGNTLIPNKWKNGFVYIRCNKDGTYKDIKTALIYTADELVGRNNVIIH